MKALVSVAALTASVLAPASAAPAAAPAPLNVLVLGDSYSAGVGAGGYRSDGTSCARSPKNYGEVFGQIVRDSGRATNVTTVACGGATTDDFFSSQSGVGVPAQLDAVNSTYDVVFATTGGNDAGYGTLVRQCLVSVPSFNVAPNATKCDAALTNAEQLVGDGSTTTSPIGTEGLKALLAVHAKAPSAKIVLIGYPMLEGDETYTVGTVAAGSRLRALQRAGDRLEQLLVDTANAQVDGSPFAFVSTQALFEGPPFHGLYATSVNPNRWMVGLTDGDLGALYHPNAYGWSQIGALLHSNAQVPTTPQPVIATTKFAKPRVGRSYSARLRTTDSRAGSWTITTGKLPRGLKKVGSYLYGRPRKAGTTKLTVLFTGRDGRTTVGNVTIKVKKR